MLFGSSEIKTKKKKKTKKFLYNLKEDYFFLKPTFILMLIR